MRRPAGWGGSVLILALLLAAVLPARGQRRLPDDDPSREWETLTGCRVLTDAAMDGDSFHVRHREREYIFRLYFVDAPETDRDQEERIEDQAAYFGINADDVPRAGRLAADFTRSQLQNQPITVLTRWRNAGGRSALARYYAVVLVNSQNLALDLVKHGWARIYGLRANWPGGPRSSMFINQLKNAELQARERGAGVWNPAQFPRVAPESVLGPDKKPVLIPKPQLEPPPLLVDLNTATRAQLVDLPGIGPALADRIIAARPYASVDELLNVKGIGKVTLDRLRTRVTVHPK